MLLIFVYFNLEQNKYQNVSISNTIIKRKIFLLEIPDLILYIWDYKDKLNDPIINTYCCWCVEVLGAKWDFNRFKDFKYVTSALLDAKKEFRNLDKFSSEIKNYVYNLIMKK